MQSGQFERNERGAIEILEGAVHLLRTAPPRCLLCYCAGTLPFVLGLLFFLTDMSHGAAARSRLIDASLGMAVLFFWMKCWQAVFAGELLAYLSDASPSGWNGKRILRLACVQSATMPWEFALLPVALLVLMPFGWSYAFFQNLSVTGDGRETLKESVRSAWKHAVLWPWQNHKILLVMAPFALFVFLNLCMAFYMFPALLKTLFGVETVLSRTGYSFFNSTSLLSVTAVTYLCVNPLMKAAYVQRCFLGASIFTGQDLLLDLRRLRRQGNLQKALAIAALALCLTASNSFAAQGEPGTPNPDRSTTQLSVAPKELDRAIREVMGGLEYSWRMPELKPKVQDESGFWKQVSELISGVSREVRNALKPVVKWLEELIESLFATKIEPKPDRKGIGTIPLWLSTLLLSVAVLCGLLLLLAMKRRKAAGGKDSEQQANMAVRVDLTDETLVANDLPVARWLALARESIAAGELRLALRALYFAGLAHLSERNLLTIASFKSNREYERELKRRAHALPALVGSFSENVAILERVWYGRHEVRRDAFERFTLNHERIMSDVENG